MFHVCNIRLHGWSLPDGTGYRLRQTRRNDSGVRDGICRCLDAPEAAPKRQYGEVCYLMISGLIQTGSVHCVLMQR